MFILSSIFNLFKWVIYSIYWILFSNEQSVDISRFDMTNFGKYLASTYSAGLNNTYLIVSKKYNMTIKLGIIFDPIKEKIRFKGDIKIVNELLSNIENYTKSIPYFENSFKDKIFVKYRSLEMMKDQSLKAFLDVTKYISPIDYNVLEAKIHRKGYWLLQGPTGTGKTSFIELMISMRCTKEKINGIYLVNTKTNIVELLEQFKEIQKNEKWIVIFEEFDRHWRLMLKVIFQIKLKLITY